MLRPGTESKYQQVCSVKIQGRGEFWHENKGEAKLNGVASWGLVSDWGKAFFELFGSLVVFAYKALTRALVEELSTTL